MDFHKHLEKLIPYVTENIISYPLWEEGDYRPQLCIFLIIDDEAEMKIYRNIKSDIEARNGGYYFTKDSRYDNHNIYDIYLFPTRGNNYCSIEEMVTLMHELITNFKAAKDANR